MHLPVDTLLQGGKYRIVRFINSGGFGCTYEAEHLMFRKRVAIKEFFVKDFCGRDERTAYVTIETTSKRGLVDKLKRKFIDEARSIFDLQHPGIVRVTDVFEENGTAYYVMDYIDGMSLKEVVDKEGALPESRALEYIRQVTDALDYVHAHNRLHLDIKPGNIMVDQNDRTILIDFGASRQYEEVGNENSSSLIPYTNGYAPPEQVGNDLVQFTPATDVYALGATLYKLLSGVTPVSSSLRNSGEQLKPLPSSTSLSTRTAVDKSMKLNRYERLQGVDAFRKALKDGGNPKKWSLPLIVCLVLLLGLFGWNRFVGFGSGDDEPLPPDSLVRVDTIPVVSPVVDVPVEPLKDDVPSTTPLYVSTSPVGATIYLDGKQLGKSPVEGQEVSRGKHTVKLVLDGYESFSKQYTFGDNPVVINKTLVAVRPLVPEEPSKPTTTPLYVSTSPVGATIYLDGKQLGKSPVEGQKVSRGKHTVKLELDGYEPFSKQYAFGDNPVVINKTLVAVRASVPEEPAKPAPPVVDTTGSINGHEYVDLGLSVKWATMNVGASRPGDYGDYFAWGEVHPKSKYTEENCNTYGVETGEISGNSLYDAARHHWGSSWRLPTEDEFKELKDKCRWIWTSQDGHNGCKVVGPNGNSIFLPVAGYRKELSAEFVGKYGCYWSGSPTGIGNKRANNLVFGNDDRILTWHLREGGQSVRPVSD